MSLRCPPAEVNLSTGSLCSSRFAQVALLKILVTQCLACAYASFRYAEQASGYVVVNQAFFFLSSASLVERSSTTPPFFSYNCILYIHIY